MKGGDHGIQTARQTGNGLRTERTELQAGDDPAHLASGDAAQESFAHQQSDVLGAPLKELDDGRQKTARAAARDFQTQAAKTRLEVAVVEAVALVTAFGGAFIAVAVQIGLSQADGFALDGLVAKPPNLPVAIAPKTALQVRDKVLILLGDRNYSAHWV